MKFLFLLLTAPLLAKAQVYVSPTRNDANAGTRDRPIRTLEHARDLVRGVLPISPVNRSVRPR